MKIGMFGRTLPSPVPPSTPPIPELSSSLSTVWDGTDIDDFSIMPADDLLRGQPLTLSISPQGHYSFKRPGLADILNSTAPPPWTLGALAAFMSQNQCLENLEFTTDAARYRNQYMDIVSQAAGRGADTAHTVIDADGVRHLNEAWDRLIDAYIRPNAPREVNLQGNVRDELLAYRESSVPRKPELLDVAVKKIHELMEYSILPTFLNSVEPLTAPGAKPYNNSDESLNKSPSEDRFTSAYSQHRSTPISRSLSRAKSPASHSEAFERHSARGLSQGTKHPSTTSHAHGFVAFPTPMRSATQSTSGSGDTSVREAGSDTPLTPPITPPMSHYGLSGSNAWKRMSSRWGLKRKSNASNSG